MQPSLNPIASHDDKGRLRHLLTLWARYKELGIKGVGPQLKTPGIWKLAYLGWAGIYDYEASDEYSEADYKLVDKAIWNLAPHLSEVIKAEHGVVIEPNDGRTPFIAKGKSKRQKAKALQLNESTYKDRLVLAEDQLVIELRGLWV